VPVSIWTSTLRRTIATANYLPYPKLRWKALDEIHAVCAWPRGWWWGWGGKGGGVKGRGVEKGWLDEIHAAHVVAVLHVDLYGWVDGRCHCGCGGCNSTHPTVAVPARILSCTGIGMRATLRCLEGAAVAFQNEPETVLSRHGTTGHMTTPNLILLFTECSRLQPEP
jgi:hypothetical protein